MVKIENNVITATQGDTFCYHYKCASSFKQKLWCKIAKVLKANYVTPLGRIILLPEDYENKRIKWEQNEVKKQSLNKEMKTIEEMIATHTKEEWQKIIRSEMNKLGLCFSEDTEYQGGNTLW